jgi:ACS family hexuronate transporter-like MFS transporter
VKSRTPQSAHSSGCPVAEQPGHKWWVCGLLLLALVLNYMDRQTLSQTITAIERDIQLNNTQYGRLEKGFGYAFAFGGLAFGIVVDRVSVRWLYPFVLLGWSAAGLATGYADHLGRVVTPLLAGWCDVQALSLTDDPSITESYLGFLVCRVILGFFEAGQWPCALVTTQRLLSPADRSFGNSILQSGASLGAILTPFVVGFFDNQQSGWWRMPYVAIGILGMAWVVPWLATVWHLDLSRAAGPNLDSGGSSAVQENRQQPLFLLLRRYFALVVVVIAINMLWQFFRAWLPKMLEQYHGYSAREVRWFIVGYYIATDVGCICTGAAVRWLANGRMSVHHARLATFAACTALTSLSVIAAQLPKGPWLLALFLLIGFGALGLFPNYYSFTQDLSARHYGKIAGSLGFITWVVSSEMQERIGKAVDATKSYKEAILWIGLTPLAGLLAMLLLWGRTVPSSEVSTKETV